VLEYQYTCTDTETKIKDLDLVEPISALELEVQCTNGATSNEDNFISDIVTKIEVVDGSEVLESMNMFQLEALHFYKTGKTPTLFPSEWAGGVQRHNAMLLFGRHLWDPLYAFDATKFKNPQLKVTFNKAAIRAAGATGFASGNNILLSIIAHVFEDAARPAKFLMQKQIDSFTSAASGEKRIELPTDYIYRMLLNRYYVAGSDVDEVISDLKLTCDTDKFIPFNRKVKQLDAVAFAKFGLARLKHDIFRGGSFTAKLVCNKEPWFTGFSRSPATPRVLVPWAQWSSQYNAELYDMAGALDATARQITGMEEGHAIHATVPYFFGRPEVPEDWFNPAVYKKVELVHTQAAANAACQILLEQVRPQ